MICFICLNLDNVKKFCEKNDGVLKDMKDYLKD